MTATSGITRFVGANDERIYSIPVPVFQTLTANVYLVVDGEYSALIDTGSGSARSNAQLAAGFDAVRSEFGEDVRWERLSRVIVTHAHVDHHGGLDFVRSLSGAPVAVHALDQRVIANYRERFLLTRRAVATFLRQSGVSGERYAGMMDLYGSAKSSFVGGRVPTVLNDGDLLDDRFTVLHAAGHCPGQVCLRLGDVLFSADHVLARTVPHLAPESITPGTGVFHYLVALEAVNREVGVRLTLGGHEEPIEDLHGRIGAIRASNGRKMKRVLEACETPRTIDQITQLLYPNVREYDVMLALQVVGAHVEYLNQQGALVVANLDQVAADEHVAPQYLRAD